LRAIAVGFRALAVDLRVLAVGSRAIAMGFRALAVDSRVLAVGSRAVAVELRVYPPKDENINSHAYIPTLIILPSLRGFAAGGSASAG
jgi:hypothetical protein